MWNLSPSAPAVQLGSKNQASISTILNKITWKGGWCGICLPAAPAPTSTFDYLPPTSSFSTFCLLVLMVQFVQYVCVWKYIPLYDLISLCKLWRVILFEFDQTPIGTLRRVPLFKECSLGKLSFKSFPPVSPWCCSRASVWIWSNRN